MTNPTMPGGAYDGPDRRVSETGVRNAPLSSIGIETATVNYNLGPADLIEHAVCGREAKLSATGAIVAETGHHTGRSASDKFVVREPSTTDTVWWGGNAPMDRSKFDVLHADFLTHANKIGARGQPLYVQDLIGGADPAHALKVRVVTEKAWHSLFIRNLLLRQAKSALETFEAEMTIIDLPSFRAHPERHGTRTETVIAVDLANRLVLIGGTAYAGEMKKSVFTALNYILPEKGVMPMHCSANEGEKGDVAIFFGLSGTGKTTLSADPRRTLIGDDEHGWSDEGVFNFEGGCYAKTIGLTPESEPEIHATTRMFGTVLENVVLDGQRRPDFDDTSLTQNGRCAYPLHYIPNASRTGRGGHPNNIIMLTCDAFGVLPPVAALTPEQAMVHFLSGYTAKVAGTERGVTEPTATFSTCFGAPFMPRNPTVYGDLLRAKMREHGTRCWLVSTGWTGGAHGTGSRMPLKATRAIIDAVLSGALDNTEMRTDPVFGFEVPLAVPGVDAALLDPRETWADKAAYDAAAEKLAGMFVENFTRYERGVEADVRAALPRMAEQRLAAE